MNRCFLILCLPLLAGTLQAEPPAAPADQTAQVKSLLKDRQGLEFIEFGALVEASTGRKVIPIDPKNPVHKEVLAKLSAVMDATLETLNAEDSPIKKQRRINEASRLIENELLRRINLEDGLICDIPPCADGSVQRSGYPDLRITHEKSELVFYLDPKLHETSNEASTLRTFFFDPKDRTGKILADACHLVAGFSHDGNTGKWKLLKWRLVDLCHMKVQLKTEFQTGNKELYREGLTVKKSGE